MNQSSEGGSSPGAGRGSGCTDQIVFALISLVTIGGIALAESTAWSVDELVFEGLGRLTPLDRQLSIVFFELGLLVPIGLLAIFWIRSRNRSIYRTWAIGLIFSLALSFARIPKITDMQLSRLLQFGIGILACFLFILLSRMRFGLTPISKPAWEDQSGVPAIALAGLLSLPWLAYGALGSPVDTILTLCTALVFGIFVGWVLQFSLFRPMLGQNNNPEQNYWRAVFAGVIAIAIMTLGISYSGFEWYLLMALPALAFPLASMNRETNPGWLPQVLFLGLAIAFPLMFVDPDEMSIIIASGPGELIQWITRAGWLTTLIAVAGGMVFFWLSHRKLPAVTGRVVGLTAILVILVGGGVYLLLGQPGFFGERLFVVFKEQANVSQASQIANYDQRRQFVYQTLVKQATQSQARLRVGLDTYHIQYQPYYLVNGIEVWGGPFVRAWLQSQPEVDRILNNPELRPLPESLPQAQGSDSAPNGVLWNQAMIGADRVWNELKITGKGIVVGQSDTGVQADHPDLVGTYRGTQSGNDYNWLDPWYQTTVPRDLSGHGTHTTGIALGKYTGIAPGATWYGCVNLARNLGNPSFYLDCMQFMLAPYPQGGDALKDGDPTRSANVMNDSWGCPDVEGCDPNALRPAVDALKAAGIFVVVSAGNNGYAGCGTVTDPPAIYASSYTVGAVGKDGNLANFSSLGPVIVDGSNRVKPDIAAPGDQVLSAFPGSTYAIASGTSMAGPHVVGVVALMWSANPKLVGDIDKTASILDQTTSPYKGKQSSCVDASKHPNDGVGWGIVDAYAAVQMAIQAK